VYILGTLPKVNAEVIGKLNYGARAGMTNKFRLPAAVVLVFAMTVMLSGCETWRGDEEVETEPEEGSMEGPGLFTGKEGGIIIFER
jgi:hypothetical protein